ncbi:MAG: hypothetical protein H6R19_2163 [Proteobacteria bacterium]|nr:hypothetical protein [Pseudomonadota bacterium]
MTEANSSSRRIRVWDLPLRLFHWTLLVLVAGAILSVELADVVSGAMDWHPRFGYAILALLIFRLIWGFVGSTHARFANFVRGPAVIIDYLKHLKDHKGPSIGHNPLGALSVLALLATLLFQTVSGLFLSDEDFFIEAPLFKYVSGTVSDLFRELHEANAGIIFTLIGLHVAAILFYRFIKRDNLITPMLTGSKEVAAEQPAQSGVGGNAWLGLVILAVSAAAVWYLVARI